MVDRNSLDWRRLRNRKSYARQAFLYWKVCIQFVQLHSIKRKLCGDRAEFIGPLSSAYLVSMPIVCTLFDLSKRLAKVNALHDLSVPVHESLK